MKEKRFMSLPKVNRIIISGGGTGGHVFPAISIANALKKMKPSVEILFVGAEGRIEMEKVPAAGYRIIGLPVTGLNRKSLFKNFSVLNKLFKSLKKSREILAEFRPDVVVGVGGYASGPLLREAGKKGIPILIQEQNSYAGVTNRLLAKKASVICVAYDGMEKFFPKSKIIKTGNPVRQNFSNLQKLKNEAFNKFGLDPQLPVILVLGGSLGADSINRCLLESISDLKKSDCQWLWQTGQYYYERILNKLSNQLIPNIFVTSFIDRMDLAFAAADIIVSRAGAGTISELCLVGKPTILVPSPNVAEDHQTKNAAALVSRNAAVMIPDNQVGNRLVAEALKLVSDKNRKELLSVNIAGMADYDADVRIAEQVLKLATG